MSPAGLLSALTFALLPVRVESTDCPLGGEVEEALVSRLASVPDTTSPDLARIWRQEGLLHVELVNPDGAVIAERALEPRGTCAETAALVAVVIASWESNVHPAFAEKQADPAPDPAVASPAELGSVKARPEASFDFAVGAGPSWAEAFALTGSTSLTWIPRGSGLGLRLAGFAETQRSFGLGQGRAVWNRWLGSAEGDWRRFRGRAAFDLHGGLALGWLSIEGTRFDFNQTRYSFSPALSLGTRIAWWTTRHLAAWLDVQSLLWLRRQSAYSLPDGATRAVPRWEGLMELGVALGKTEQAR